MLAAADLHRRSIWRVIVRAPFKLGEDAALALARHHFGGYWLAGFRRRPALVDSFECVRFSSPHALSDTLANMPRGAFLERLTDIDTPED